MNCINCANFDALARQDSTKGDTIGNCVSRPPMHYLDVKNNQDGSQYWELCKIARYPLVLGKMPACGDFEERTKGSLGK